MNRKIIKSHINILTKLIYNNFNNKTIEYQYDSIGNRAKMVCPDGKEIEYNYDFANNLTGIDYGSLKFSFQYDGLNRILTKNYPNGIQIKHNYDSISRLTELRCIKTNNELLTFNQYTYDKVGNILSMKDNLGLHQYDYNKIYRLTGVK